MYWNINNMKNKVESDILLSLFSEYDMIFLSEVKRRVTQVPGFEVYEAANENYSRGGLVLLIKPHIDSDIKYIDKSVNEQLWLELKSVPDVIFGGVYIPPTDSIYFKDDAFAQIQSKTIDPDKHQIVGGDMNARCGNLVEELCNNPNMSYSFSDATINSSGRDLIQVCKDNNLQIVNGLKIDEKSFPSKLTFRRRKNWISEVDRCVVSSSIVGKVTSFDINCDLNLPSDHAPICVSVVCSKQLSSNRLYEAACDLEGHAVLYRKTPNSICKKPLSCQSINPEVFSNTITKYEATIMEVLQAGSPDTVAEAFNNIMYNASLESKIPR
jgi:exonuclease III